MRLRLQRNIMVNDNTTEYPKFEENILDDILGGDDDVLEQLQISNRVSYAIMSIGQQNRKKDLIDDVFMTQDTPGPKNNVLKNSKKESIASAASASSLPSQDGPIKKFKTNKGMFQDSESESGDNRNSNDVVDDKQIKQMAKDLVSVGNQV